jgi:hypothetical protein
MHDAFVAIALSDCAVEISLARAAIGRLEPGSRLTRSL